MGIQMGTIHRAPTTNDNDYQQLKTEGINEQNEEYKCDDTVKEERLR